MDSKRQIYIWNDMVQKRDVLRFEVLHKEHKHRTKNGKGIVGRVLARRKGRVNA